MGRKERPLGPGPLHDFAWDLRELRAGTGMTYRTLARRAGFSASALSAAASGEMLPTLDVLLAYVGACGGEPTAWEQRWQELAASQRRTELGPRNDTAAGAGTLEVTPPVAAPALVALSSAAAVPAELSPALPQLPAWAPTWTSAPAPVEAPATPPTPAQETPPAQAEPGRGGKHSSGRRRGPVLPVRLGLAPIILATTAIVIYSVLLPASDTTQLVPPKTKAPIVTLPVPHSHTAASSPRVAQPGSTGLL